MRASNHALRAFAILTILGVPGCMPTEVDYMPSSDVQGDCITKNENLRIRSATDARSLPEQCFSVNGTVEVLDSDLTDLEALRYLRRANGLVIKDNPQLLSLAGLDHVSVSKEIWVASNPELGDLDGLDGTEEVAEVKIERNPALVTIAGLRSLRVVGDGGLTVVDNGGLTDLAELDRLERVGRLKVSNNRGMTALKLKVHAVAGDVEVSDNPDLNQIAGFANLETVGGNFLLERNTSLGVTNGFTAKFRTVGGNLSIDGNPSLTDIYELAVNLYAVGGSVIATNNTSLSQCRAEDLDFYLEEIGGLIDIGDNGVEWDPCH